MKKILKFILVLIIGTSTIGIYNAKSIDEIEGQKSHHHYIHYYNVSNNDYTGVQAEHVKSGQWIGAKIQACGKSSGPYYNYGDVSTGILTCYANNASGWLPGYVATWYE